MRNHIKNCFTMLPYFLTFLWKHPVHSGIRTHAGMVPSFQNHHHIGILPDLDSCTHHVDPLLWYMYVQIIYRNIFAGIILTLDLIYKNSDLAMWILRKWLCKLNRTVPGVGSNPTVDKNFHFVFFFCLFRVPHSSTGPIQMISSMTLIQGNRCIEKRLF